MFYSVYQCKCNSNVMYNGLFLLCVICSFEINTYVFNLNYYYLDD